MFMKFRVLIFILLMLLLVVIPPISSSPVNDSLELPTKFCWCDIDGIDYTTPVKNQAPAPTCEAYALVQAVETLVQYQIGQPCGIDLSETHLYFYANGTVARGGVHLQDAANYLIDHGVPDEGCFPDPHRPYDPETPYESVEGWENRTVKISEWGWVDQRTDAMKQALVEHGPLIVCIIQRKDFLTYKGGIYTPRRWQDIESGHVVTIVGYDDEQECWIYRNSAGTGWGEDGYARVSYSAHNPYTPILWPFYGGSGVMYVDGVYGNFQPGAPQVYITSPQRDYTYFFGRELPMFFPQIAFIQKRAPRIFGTVPVIVDAKDTDNVTFYLDGEQQFFDDESPFEWTLDTTKGLHTIEVIAQNSQYISKDVLDIYIVYN